jgi:hypothetical protein
MIEQFQHAVASLPLSSAHLRSGIIEAACVKTYGRYLAALRYSFEKAKLASQSVSFLVSQPEHEIGRISLAVALYSAVQLAGFHPVKGSNEKFAPNVA